MITVWETLLGRGGQFLWISESRSCHNAPWKGWMMLWVWRLDDGLVVKRSIPRPTGAGVKTCVQKLLVWVVAGHSVWPGQMGCLGETWEVLILCSFVIGWNITPLKEIQHKTFSFALFDRLGFAPTSEGFHPVWASQWGTSHGAAEHS